MSDYNIHEFAGYTPQFETSLDQRIKWLTKKAADAKREYDHWQFHLDNAVARKEHLDGKLAQSALSDNLVRRDGGLTEQEWLGNEVES